MITHLVLTLILHTILVTFRPSDSQLARARRAKLRDIMTWSVIKDIGTYFLFLLVVSKLAYSEKDPHQYLFRQDLLNAFQSGKYTFGPDFEDVSLRIDDFLFVSLSFMLKRSEVYLIFTILFLNSLFFIFFIYDYLPRIAFSVLLN